jgi:hypothetical protein
MVGNFSRLTKWDKNEVSIKEVNFRILSALKELFNIHWEAECEN